MINSAAQAERYHGLDAVRALAMLLGVVLHAMLIYTQGWLFAEILPDATRPAPEPTTLTAALTLWIHLWRMPLFMVLAGFFAAMVLEKRGARAFAGDRALRIGVTLLLFMTLHGIAAGHPWGKLEHLWFLWWLIWFSGLAAVWVALGLGVPALRLGSARDGAVLWLGTVAVTALGRAGGLEGRIPDTVFEPALRSFVCNGALFAAGLALWAGRDALADLSRPAVWGGWLGAGLAAFSALVGLGAGTGAPQVLPVWLTVPLAATVTLGMVLGLIGLAQGTVRGGGRVLRAITRLAFPVYVLHLYPVLTITSLLHEAGAGPTMAVLTGSALTLTLCALLYGVIALTPLDWLFAGPRRAWWRWPMHRRRPGTPRGQS